MRSPFELENRDLQLATRFGLVIEGRFRAGRLALILAAVAWLPLLLLSLADGAAIGSPPTVPLLGDFLAYGRFLVALPLLVLMHPMANRELAIVIAMLQQSGLVAPGDKSALQHHFDRARSLWQNPLIRIGLLGASVLVIFLPHPAEPLIKVSTWMSSSATGVELPTAAGRWQFFISGPLMRFLLLLALWKLLICWGILWKLAAMSLRYEPLHPDRCAGIAFLDRVQVGFAGLVAALGVQLGCLIADAVTHQGAELGSFKLPVVAFVVLMLVLLFAPMLAFLRPIGLACIRTQAEFHSWAGHAARQVASAIQETSEAGVAAQLASPEISTLTDAAALYDNAAQTRKLPVSRQSVTIILAAALLPMGLPLLPLLPLKELAKRLAGLVL